MYPTIIIIVAVCVYRRRRRPPKKKHTQKRRKPNFDMQLARFVGVSGRATGFRRGVCMFLSFDQNVNNERN